VFAKLNKRENIAFDVSFLQLQRHILRYLLNINKQETHSAGNNYLCDTLSKLIFTGALALVGRVT
jgi:hypothetical protein